MKALEKVAELLNSHPCQDNVKYLINNFLYFQRVPLDGNL